MSIILQVSRKIADLNANRVLIHSDIMRGFPVKFINRNDFVVKHIELLKELSNNMAIWMPSFNYDFCKGKEFSIKETPSQLGVLSEYFRKEISEWRTHTPVFSFSGTGDKPYLSVSETIDPFNSDSAFHLMNNNDSLLMHYGSEFKHTTFIHYIERMSGNLQYRYDKIFKGYVLFPDNIRKKVKFLFHVRPLGYHLDYDWDKITSDLKENNILYHFSEKETNILLLNIGEMTDFLLRKVAEDNLYLLDQESLNWVIPKLDKLGRPFLITDFE
ncbi:MAG: AAC(3) family N-acetyltransferase [Bacteroidales bacterium]|nr:AAC(3) family N-acetyltransferase [Bacteroidales bacterium]